jgi:hypothetical protein
MLCWEFLLIFFRITLFLVLFPQLIDKQEMKIFV